MNIFTYDLCQNRMAKEMEGTQLRHLKNARDEVCNGSGITMNDLNRCASGDILFLHNSDISTSKVNLAKKDGSTVVLFSGGGGNLLEESYAPRVKAFKHLISDPMFKQDSTWVDILKYLLHPTEPIPDAFIEYTRITDEHRKTIKEKDKARKVVSYIYSNSDDFTELWKMILTPPSTEGEQQEHIVIYWDWFPEGSNTGLAQVNLKNILTPYDWAIAYSYSCLVSVQPIPWISIVCFNDAGSQIPDDLFTKAFWICRFKEKYKPKNNPFLPPLKNCGEKFDTSVMVNLHPLIKRYFSDAMGSMDNHHAAANLIAPALMDCGLAACDEDEWISQLLCGTKMPQFAAFCCLVKLFYNEQNTAVACDVSSSNNIRFVFIDDQKDLFEPVLRKALNLKAQSDFISFESVDAYKEDQDIKDQDILLLDLRLWKDTKEKEACLDELKIIKANQECLSAKLKKQWAKVIDSLAIACPGEGKESLSELTLQPLQIAAENPAMPIIIFSSTQQRYITEVFKVCPNIITRFTKPYPGKYYETMDPKLVMEGFYEALSSALEMRKVGIVWHDAQKIKNCDKLFWDQRIGHSLALTNDNKPHPYHWLAWEWLPAMQRCDYGIASAMPWMYLRNLLGATRMDMLQRRLSAAKKGDEKELFEIIRKGHLLFPMTDLESLMSEKVEGMTLKKRQREIAIAVGLAFVSLMVEWYKRR